MPDVDSAAISFYAWHKRMLLAERTVHDGDSSRSVHYRLLTAASYASFNIRGATTMAEGPSLPTLAHSSAGALAA